MNIEEKMELIKLLSELNGLIITSKLKGEDINLNMKRQKRVAQKLSEEGIYNFDFSSDEKFEQSVSNFLEV